jgi:hypothetical protein
MHSRIPTPTLAYADDSSSAWTRALVGSLNGLIAAAADPAELCRGYWRNPDRPRIACAAVGYQGAERRGNRPVSPGSGR